MESLSDCKSTTFFEIIKNTEGLDLRDKRGKKHCFAVVILGVLIALFRDRDGNLPSIHRALTNTHSDFCSALGMEFSPPVSRAQLPIILKKRMSKFSQNFILIFLESN